MEKISFYKKLREVFEENIAVKLTEAFEEQFAIYEKIVTKDEFNELKEIVRELSFAQKRSEEKIGELVEAQKKTEERMNKLEEKMAELAEAQKKTEERMNKLEEKMAELAEAQKETEKAIKELVEAQKKTEKRINNLTEIVGGHSHTIGQILEDKAILKLPFLLKERYGIEVEGKLRRGFIKNDKDEFEETNIYGYGKRDGEKVLILGEGKSRFGKGDLKDFLKKVKRFERKNKVFPIIITYIFSSPKVEEEVKKLNLSYFLSFELEG